MDERGEEVRRVESGEESVIETILSDEVSCEWESLAQKLFSSIDVEHYECRPSLGLLARLPGSRRTVELVLCQMELWRSLVSQAGATRPFLYVMFYNHPAQIRHISVASAEEEFKVAAALPSTEEEIKEPRNIKVLRSCIAV